MNTPEELEAELAALKRSIADLSHPVCRMLLDDSAHTEARLDQVLKQRDDALAKLAQREAEVEQLHHINDACIELENQLRAALERAAQAAAILNQSHA